MARFPHAQVHGLGPRSQRPASKGSGATTALGPFALPAPARLLWFALVVALLLRLIAPLLPGHGWWGVDLLRDSPQAGLLGWLACALALVPALSAPLVARLPRAARDTRGWTLALAVLLGLLAWNFPERAFLTGDTALRHGRFAVFEHPELLVPQALPADLLLHYTLPRWMQAHTPIDVEHAARLWGTLLAAASALTAWSLSRAAAKRGAAAFAAATAAAFTATLALCNGYAKSIVELNVVVLVAAGALLSLARGDRGIARLGLAVGIALVLHRSALALVPAWLAGLLMVQLRDAGAWKRPASWLGVLAPLAALALTGARSLRTLTTFDASHHLSGTATSGGSWLAATFSPLHLLDVLQVVLLTAPLAIPLGVLLIGRPALWRRAELAVFAALVLPQLAMLLLVHPQQGLFRDWDVFVTAGVALSALAAWLVAEAIDSHEGAAWLALPVALMAAVPATQWLALQSDVPRALARAEAVLAGPPQRPYAEIAQGFDHIGMVRFNRDEFQQADEAFRRSIAAAPNPRLYVQWGMSATMQRRPEEAMQHYLDAVRLDPQLAAGWKGVAAAAAALDDLDRMRQAAAALRVLAPDDPTTQDALDYLKARAPGGE